MIIIIIITPPPPSLPLPPSMRLRHLIELSCLLMDHLHYRLNFDLDKNFITAWKSITKLVIFQSFVAKCCKMRII
jgi:hypothetical protein